MTSTRSALDLDWLGVCRRAVVGLERVLDEAPSTEERARETGERGSGGDRTLEIDSAAERVVLDELQMLSDEGHRFVAFSEELGAVDYGDQTVRVIVDPIDGSLNAKRRIPHYALSIAVAGGETMADVEFGFVHDFGLGEEWWARRGEGAWLSGSRLDPALEEAASASGANWWRTFVRISLPLLGPAILSGAIYNFMTAISMFDAQASSSSVAS